MLEAMAHKNALISTTTEGGKFLVAPNKSGFLYSHGDIKALTDSIQRLMQNPKLREQMKHESFAKAQKLTWENLWGEYIELYKSIAL
jgi:glycosyltransferase involved in cell wall biosynthesis